MIGPREHKETKQSPSSGVANNLARETVNKNVVYSCDDEFMAEKQCRLKEWRVTEGSLLDQVIREGP